MNVCVVVRMKVIVFVCLPACLNDRLCILVLLVCFVSILLINLVALRNSVLSINLSIHPLIYPFYFCCAIEVLLALLLNSSEPKCFICLCFGLCGCDSETWTREPIEKSVQLNIFGSNQAHCRPFDCFFRGGKQVSFIRLVKLWHKRTQSSPTDRIQVHNNHDRLIFV